MPDSENLPGLHRHVPAQVIDLAARNYREPDTECSEETPCRIEYVYLYTDADGKRTEVGVHNRYVKAPAYFPRPGQSVTIRGITFNVNAVETGMEIDQNNPPSHPPTPGCTAEISYVQG